MKRIELENLLIVFYDLKDKFRFTVIDKYRSIKNKQKIRNLRSPRRVVTFWNKNYFLKFRKRGYNNLIYRRRYKVRDKIFKMRRLRNRLKNLNYFLFNPRFWKIKGYNTLIHGFKIRNLSLKGYRSRVKHFQLNLLMKRRKKWYSWQFFHFGGKMSKKKKGMYFKKIVQFNEDLSRKKIFHLPEGVEDMSRVERNVRHSAPVLLHDFLQKKKKQLNIVRKLKTIKQKNMYLKNIISNSFIKKKKLLKYQNFKEYVFLNEIIPNIKKKKTLFKYHYIFPENVKFRLKNLLKKRLKNYENFYLLSLNEKFFFLFFLKLIFQIF